MQVIRGITLSVVLAVCLSFVLSLLPVHSLQIDSIMQRNSIPTESDPVKRVIDACQTLEMDGRIDQITRHDSGVAIQFSSNQSSLNNQVYVDIYNLLYRNFTFANVPTMTIKVIAAGTGNVLCTVDAKQSALTNPLPQKSEIADYVLQHFMIQLP